MVALASPSAAMPSRSVRPAKNSHLAPRVDALGGQNSQIGGFSPAQALQQRGGGCEVSRYPDAGFAFVHDGQVPHRAHDRQGR